MTATTGPWKVDDQFGGTDEDPRRFIRGENSFVAQTLGGNDEANARLIAADPDLLHACKEAKEMLKCLGYDAKPMKGFEDTTFSALCKAIAQAEGELK